MKLVLTILLSVLLCLAFLYGVDKEIARHNFLEETKKPFPDKINGCIFYDNCRYYNNIIRGISR